MPNIIGTYPKHERIETGCLSLDWAVAGQTLERKPLLGLPLGVGYHVWAQETGVGKTTMCLSLLGMIAAATGKDVAISPIDTFDIGNMMTILEYAGMGDDQNVEIVLDEKSSDSKTMSMLNKALSKKNTVATLLDSAYAVMSTAVEEGEPEDANMGRDAKMISSYARQAKHIVTRSLREQKVFFVTNQSFENMSARKGFGPPPMRPARGMTLMGQTSVHIELKQQYARNKAVRNDVGRLLHGKVKKNTSGPALREFDIYTVGGVGIHKGITAIFDLLSAGILQEEKVGKSFKIISGEDVLEPLSVYIENWDHPELFVPFLKLAEEKRNSFAVVEPKEEDDGEKFEQTPEELYEG